MFCSTLSGAGHTKLKKDALLKDFWQLWKRICTKFHLPKHQVLCEQDWEDGKELVGILQPSISMA
jgi:hypothetical protein